MKLVTVLLWTVALVAGSDDDYRRRHRAPAETPEPATIGVVGAAIGGLIYLRRKRK